MCGYNENLYLFCFSSNLLWSTQILDRHKTCILVPWIDTTVSFCLFQALAHGACCKNVMLKRITRHTHRLAVLLSLSLPQIKLHSSVEVVQVFSHVQVAQSYTVIRGICCLIFVLNVERFPSWGVTTVLILARGNMISRDTLEIAMKKNTSFFFLCCCFQLYVVFKIPVFWHVMPCSVEDMHVCGLFRGTCWVCHQSSSTLIVTLHSRWYREYFWTQD